MGQTSHIEWTDATWNVAVGCRKVDEDCKFCYMYRDSFNGTRYDPRKVRKTKTVFDLPLRLKEPKRIFTSSLTDFFLPEIDEYRHELWDIIYNTPQHRYQILTKRPERILECLPDNWKYGGYDHVMIGTSVGSMASWHRVEILEQIPVNRFYSFEPLHGAIPYTAVLGISSESWVIIGGESGNKTGKYLYRACELEWIEQIMHARKVHNAPVFIKQLGTYQAVKMKLRDRHGRDMSEWPEHLRVREFPESLIVKKEEI
ncbi:COG4422 Bacteriophage protein gp37 [uncultured Caudovirales phage]|uniref:COG4422 Bacteriophage protein gp37 n=1 Tax=uncultured Caudovirales phage TaxID=2100421 RepID=A0A6J5M1I6_9CAUD|nr:COG4422 Bacteriophage protein gp37 [uncultured Caudovirales phage]